MVGKIQIKARMIHWRGVVLVKMLMTKTYEKTDSGGETPLEILKRRYANGEINREEYEEKKKDLQS
jgi:putative membrane protein